MVVSTFPVLSDHRLDLIPKHFYHFSKKTPYSLSSQYVLIPTQPAPICFPLL